MDTTLLSVNLNKIAVLRNSRGGVRPESFVGRWVHRWLYYDAPEWLFAALYVAWALATLVTLAAAPPRRKAG